MIKKGSGYKPRVFSLLPRYFLLAVAIAAAPPVYAQEALPGTPPVLRDFRLDPVPTKPARPPRDEPLIVPREEQPAPARSAPVVRPTAPATAPVDSIPTPVTVAPRTTTRPTASPDRQADGTTAPSSIESKARDTTIITQSGEDPPVAAPVLPSVLDTEQAQDLSETITTKAPTQAFPYWWMLAALAAVAVVFSGIRRFFSGRKEDIVPHVDVEEIEPVAPVMPIISEDAPVPAPAMLELSFAPSTATISINNLIIKGALKISNQDNKSNVSDMRLRLIVISASEIQDEVIEAFHADPDQRFVEKLGDAKPGEQITMDVTLSVPLSEIHSYQLGAKSLFAPIVVANVIYGSGVQGTRYEARLACMIGREANPPTEKMGALRMDLGPRSFGMLGQRPLFG